MSAPARRFVVIEMDGVASTYRCAQVISLYKHLDKMDGVVATYHKAHGSISLAHVVAYKLRVSN